MELFILLSSRIWSGQKNYISCQLFRQIRHSFQRADCLSNGQIRCTKRLPRSPLVSSHACLHAQTQTLREKHRLTTEIIFRPTSGLCTFLIQRIHKNLTSDIFISLVNQANICSALFTKLTQNE